jgi:REP element-mobilizing transposase RayT
VERCQEGILLIKRFIFVETDKCSVLCHMTNREKERLAMRALGKGYYHFCTDGWKGGKLFNNTAEYAFGMILMGLISLRHSLRIYAFTLMPNHIHIILSGTGEDCLEAFDFLRRKLSARLRKDGFRPLPEDYWFAMERIETPEKMRGEILYVLRNALEEDLGIVGGYLWSSGWLYHSGFCELLNADPARKYTRRQLIQLLGGTDEIPSHWRLHPYLGLLPDAFVDTSVVLDLFPTAKDLQTALVKDYEVQYQIAGRLGELARFNKEETESIVSQTLQKRFEGRSLRSMTDTEKGKLAIILNREFGLNPYQISTSIYIKKEIVQQLLNAKELR